MKRPNPPITRSTLPARIICHAVLQFTQQHPRLHTKGRKPLYPEALILTLALLRTARRASYRQMLVCLAPEALPDQPMPVASEGGGADVIGINFRTAQKKIHSTRYEPHNHLATHIENTLRQVLQHDANTRARKTGFVQRQHKLTGSTFAQMIVFGAASNPCPTDTKWTQAATVAGTPLTPQGIDQRFTPEAAHFLYALIQRFVERVITTCTPEAAPLRQRSLKSAIWGRREPAVRPDAPLLPCFFALTPAPLPRRGRGEPRVPPLPPRGRGGHRG